MKYLLPLVLLFPLAVHAEVYKWVDEEGNVHYGGRPPEKEKYEQFKVQIGNTVESAEAEDEDAAEDGEIRKSDLYGRWTEKGPDQTITLYLSATGRAEWKVRFQGRDHSRGKGDWSLEGKTLVLNLRWDYVNVNGSKENLRQMSLGRDEYTISSLTGSELKVTGDSDHVFRK